MHIYVYVYIVADVLEYREPVFKSLFCISITHLFILHGLYINRRLFYKTNQRASMSELMNEFLKYSVTQK